MVAVGGRTLSTKLAHTAGAVYRCLSCSPETGAVHGSWHSLVFARWITGLSKLTVVILRNRGKGRL